MAMRAGRVVRYLPGGRCEIECESMDKKKGTTSKQKITMYVSRFHGRAFPGVLHRFAIDATSKQPINIQHEPDADAGSPITRQRAVQLVRELASVIARPEAFPDPIVYREDIAAVRSDEARNILLRAIGLCLPSRPPMEWPMTCVSLDDAQAIIADLNIGMKHRLSLCVDENRRDAAYERLCHEARVYFRGQKFPLHDLLVVDEDIEPDPAAFSGKRIVRISRVGHQ
jgi:hypothetical protein